MNKEIERKFLVKYWPDNLTFTKRIAIRQGYLSIDDHNEVRIREAGHVYMLTVKSLAMQERDEMDITIDRTRFQQLWPLTADRRIRKWRSVARLDDHTIELDQFLDQHDGLLIAEVEFPNLTVAEAFVPYDWMGQEVTLDAAYKNRNLAIAMEKPMVG